MYERPLPSRAAAFCFSDLFVPEACGTPMNCAIRSPASGTTLIQYGDSRYRGDAGRFRGQLSSCYVVLRSWSLRFEPGVACRHARLHLVHVNEDLKDSIYNLSAIFS